MRILVFLLFLPLFSLQAIDFDLAAHEIINAGLFCNRLRVCPGICGCFSRRLHGDRIAITFPGRHKSELIFDDIFILDLNERHEFQKNCFDDTRLHSLLFRCSDEIGAVLHTHTVRGIALTRLLESHSCLVTEGFDIHKVFFGHCHPKSVLEIPIFENHRDIEVLAAEISSCLRKKKNVFGFLIRGHGLFTWGCDMREAKLRAEAFEHLFECELLVRCCKCQP